MKPIVEYKMTKITNKHKSLKPPKAVFQPVGPMALSEFSSHIRGVKVDTSQADAISPTQGTHRRYRKLNVATNRAFCAISKNIMLWLKWFKSSHI